MRQLSLFFGSDIYAVAMTLSVFMGGLSLGSLIASRFADRVARPLLVYGIVEIGIACFAFLFPVILSGFTAFYQEAYQAAFADNAAYYQAVRILVSVIAMLPPTVLMGATLPLLVRRFATDSASLGARVGWFYAVNTLGALVGTLVAGFVQFVRLALPDLAEHLGLAPAEARQRTGPPYVPSAYAYQPLYRGSIS